MDLEACSRRNNIRIISLPESIEDTRPIEFLGIGGSSSHFNTWTGPCPLRPSSQWDKPRSVVICFHKFRIWDRGKLQYRGTPIHIFEDFSPNVLQMRSEYRDIMSYVSLGLKPAKLFVTLEDGKKRLFPVKEAQDSHP